MEPTPWRSIVRKISHANGVEVSVVSMPTARANPFRSRVLAASEVRPIRNRSPRKPTTFRPAPRSASVRSWAASASCFFRQDEKNPPMGSRCAPGPVQQQSHPLWALSLAAGGVGGGVGGGGGVVPPPREPGPPPGRPGGCSPRPRPPPRGGGGGTPFEDCGWGRGRGHSNADRRAVPHSPRIQEEHDPAGLHHHDRDGLRVPLRMCTTVNLRN